MEYVKVKRGGSSGISGFPHVKPETESMGLFPKNTCGVSQRLTKRARISLKFASIMWIKTLISLRRIDLQSKLIGNFIKEIVPRRSEVPCYSATFDFTTTRPKTRLYPSK